MDKPLGWTSFQLVKKLRGAMLARLRHAGYSRKLKVGHAGTLDPLASGVMIICTGKATSLIERLQSGEKEYVATITLGATTPSYDMETVINGTYPTDHITEEKVGEILKKFTGELQQVPPAFSACKVGGDRAYKMARQGVEVEIKPKNITISQIELLKFKPTELKLRIVCSKGTYIRALARDLGEALESGAYLTALRRTRVGHVSIYSTMSLDDALDLIYHSPIEILEEPS